MSDLPTDPDGRTTVRASVAQAMAALDPDGLFQPSAAAAVRAAVEDAGPLDFDHPTELFGPWQRLTPRARAVLRKLIEEDVARSLDLWPHGTLWTGAVRSARTLDRFMAENAVGRGWRGWVVSLAERLRAGPLVLDRRRRVASQMRRWRTGREVGPATLLVRLGLEPAWLLGGFARGVALDERARHYYHDRGRNVVRAYHVSLDLIPTEDGWVLSEINLEPGALQPRLEQRFGEAMGEGIVDSAVEQGARHVYLFESHRFEIRSWVLSDLHRAAARHGISVQAFEDPCMPPRRTDPPGGTPGPWPYRFDPRRDSLVVHRNSLAAGMDHLLNHKTAMARALDDALRERGETRIRVLPLSRTPEDVVQPSHSGVPNVVYKYPVAMAGKGVFFMKVGDAEEAIRIARKLDQGRDDGPGYFQPFVASRLIEGCVQDIRVWALLSPRETRFLRAVRSLQGTPLPEDLPYGLVEGSTALMPKIKFGGWDERVPPEEEPPIREITAVLGSVLRGMLDETFVTTDGPGRGAA